MGEHIYKGRKLELLIPASSLEVLKIAVIYGADAVYIGGEAFGLRAKVRYMLQQIFLHIIMIWMEQDSILKN